MEINTKLGTHPDDWDFLEFKTAQTFLPKDLNRLEKETTEEKPTNFIFIQKHIFADYLNQLLPLFLLGSHKSYNDFDFFWSENLCKRINKDVLIGQVYYAGQKNAQKTIHFLVWKGNDNQIALQEALKNYIPKTYLVEFTTVEKNDYLYTPKPFSKNIFKEDYTFVFSKPQIVFTTENQKISIPKNTKISIDKEGNSQSPFLIGIRVNQEYINIEMTLNDLETNTTLLNKINRLDNLKKEDWESWFEKIGSHKIVEILQSFDEEEQEYIINNNEFQLFLISKIDTQKLLEGIADWEVSMLGLLKMLRSTNKLEASYYKELFSNHSWNDFLSVQHHTLLPLETKEDWNQFALYSNLDAINKGILIDYHLAPKKILELSIEQLIDEELTYLELLSHTDYIATLQPEHNYIYDDLLDKNRCLKMTPHQIDLVHKVGTNEIQNISSLDKNAIIDWFQINALTEAFLLLDISKSETKVIFRNYKNGHLPIEELITSLTKIYQENKIPTATLKNKIENEFGKEYPILYILDDFKELVSTTEKKLLDNYIENQLVNKLKQINNSYKRLRENDTFVWNLDAVIKKTFTSLGIPPQSSIGQIITTHQASLPKDENLEKSLQATLSIGFVAYSMLPNSGSLALIDTAEEANMSIYELFRKAPEYYTLESSNNTALLQAQILTKEQPQFLWIVLAILQTLGNIIDTITLLKKRPFKTIKSKEAAKEYAQELTLILAKEKGISIDNKNYLELHEFIEKKALEEAYLIEISTNISRQFDHSRFAISTRNFRINNEWFLIE